MFWTIISVGVILGFVAWFILIIGCKTNKPTIGQKIIDKEFDLAFAGNIFNQEKVVIKFNNDIYEHCILRKNFVYCYDAYGNFKQVLVKDNDKCFEIFHMFPEEQYIYKSGSWDNFVLDSVDRFISEAKAKKEYDEMQNDMSERNLKKHFNELFERGDE